MSEPWLSADNIAENLGVTRDTSNSDGFDEGEVRTISETVRVLNFDFSSGFKS